MPRAAHAASAVACALAAHLAGCALLVNPDEGRLGPPDGGDVARPDREVPRQDVPPGSDAPVDRPDGAAPDSPPSGCPTACDDGVACTTDRCNEPAGRCEFVADNARCPEGEVCDPAMGCVMRPCGTDAECDDRNVCNGAERCAGGRCVGGAPLACDDGNFCNGAEACDPAAGCRTGTPPVCDDGNPCTADACDAAMGACVARPIDADRDGAPAASVGGMACAGGTDCDDGNPAVRPGAAEACNGRDDDCNGIVDDASGCPPPNDRCETATPITVASGRATVVMGTTVGASNRVSSACSRSGAPTPDVWYSVTYDVTNDLRIEVAPAAGSSGDPVLVVRETCAGPDVICNDDATSSARGSRIWIRGVPLPGRTRTLYIAVDSFQNGAEGPFALTVEPTPGLPSATCGSSLLDVTPGGAVLGLAVGRTSASQGSCTPPATLDRTEDVYEYNGPPGQVELAVYPRGAAYTPSLYFRRTSCTTGLEADCDNGNPARISPTHAGGAGFVFVDNVPTGARYILTVLAP